MGEGNRKLSKRDPGSGLLDYVDRGFLPEGLLNYLALLGWGIAEDRDVFTMQEMAEAFDIRRVNPSPARFDMKKLEAINSAHMRRISLPDMTERVIPFLAEAELVDEPIASRPAHAARRRDAAGARADQHAVGGRADAGLPVRGRRRLHPHRRDRRGRARGRAGVVRRPVRARRLVHGRRSRRRCASRWSRAWVSSRATRSARSGSRSPAAGSARRCSSRWSCSVATGPWAACRRRWHDPPGSTWPGARSPRTGCPTTASRKPAARASGGRWPASC